MGIPPRIRTTIALIMALSFLLDIASCGDQAKVRIREPEDGETISRLLDEACGSYANVSDPQKIWLLEKLGQKCWPLVGPVDLHPQTGEWDLGPVEFFHTGNIEIVIVQADSKGHQMLDEAEGNASGFDCQPIPDGLRDLKWISVTVVEPTSTPRTPTPTPTPTPTRPPAPPTPEEPEVVPIPGCTFSGKVLARIPGQVGRSLEGAQVSLYKDPNCRGELDGDEEFVLSRPTDSEGSFTFKDRSRTCYLLQVDTSNTGYVSEVDSFKLDLTNTCHDVDDILVFPRTGSILGHVWVDANRNGQMDPDEEGAPSHILYLWADQDCDGEPEDRVPPLEPIDETSTQINGQYRFDGVQAESCYAVEFELPPGAVLTTGEAQAHVCMRMACIQDVFAKEVSFGYYRVPPPDPTPTPPAITWYPVDSPTCNPYQKFTYVEPAPSNMHLNLYGVAMAPPNQEFWKYEVDYATRDCSTREDCYVHVVTNDDPTAPARLAVFSLDGLPSGQEILIRLRVVTVDGTYDEGCKAWVTIP